MDSVLNKHINIIEGYSTPMILYNEPEEQSSIPTICCYFDNVSVSKSIKLKSKSIEDASSEIINLIMSSDAVKTIESDIVNFRIDASTTVYNRTKRSIPNIVITSSSNKEPFDLYQVRSDSLKDNEYVYFADNESEHAITVFNFNQELYLYLNTALIVKVSVKL